MNTAHHAAASTRRIARGKDYERIWNRELDESPLKTVTRNQATKLAVWATERFGEDRVAVDRGMRYGNPSIEDALGRLSDAPPARREPSYLTTGNSTKVPLLPSRTIFCVAFR